MWVQKLRDRDTTWLLVAPVSNLSLGEATNFEYCIDQVTLVAASRLPYRRKRFGFTDRISKLRKRSRGFLDRFFSGETVFALVRRSGQFKEIEIKTLNLVREELSLLALSQLGSSKRWDFAPLSLSKERPSARRSYFFLDTAQGGWTQPNKRVGGVVPLRLDEDWKRLSKELFFEKYLRILRGEHSVAKSFREARTLGCYEDP